MMINIDYKNIRYRANLQEPLDISIPLKEGTSNPNCYWADAVNFETIRSGSFIGSVKEGGSVNYQKVSLTPHGNGTHTECYGHISADGATLNQSLQQFHFIAELITVEPVRNTDADEIILLETLLAQIRHPGVQALIVRTSPNNKSKKTRQYSGTNPPYFAPEAIRKIVSMDIEHILTDLPSLDKEADGGKLMAHKIFWQFPNAVRTGCTITELIYVDDAIADGLYLLNLQVTSLEMDASPSKPVLYKISEVL